MKNDLKNHLNYFPRESPISLDYVPRNIKDDTKLSYDYSESLADRTIRKIPRIIGTGIIVLTLMGGSYLMGLKQGLKYGRIEERNYISETLDDNAVNLRFDALNGSMTAEQQDSLLNIIYSIENMRGMILNDLPKIE